MTSDAEIETRRLARRKALTASDVKTRVKVEVKTSAMSAHSGKHDENAIRFQMALIATLGIALSLRNEPALLRQVRKKESGEFRFVIEVSPDLPEPEDVVVVALTDELRKMPRFCSEPFQLFVVNQAPDDGFGPLFRNIAD